MRLIVCFAALLYLACSDRTTPWSSVGYQSDSSSAGWGVKTTRWPLSAVQECGRLSEGQCLRSAAGHSAREAALGAAGLRKQDGGWTCDPGPLEDEITDYWEVNPEFKEGDAAGLRESLWHTVRMGQWQRVEDIMLLEARACEKGVQRLVCGVYGLKIRQLFLLDNMSLVLCLSRGRARSFEVLVVIRKIYSYCMARGVRPYFRWIPSELNSSDDPSRQLDENRSALATRAIEHLRFDSVALSAQGARP